MTKGLDFPKIDPFNTNFSGRIGLADEQFLNDELFKLYNVLKYIVDDYDPNSESDTNGPPAKMSGSLWLDMGKGAGDLKYFDNNKWNLLFGDRFKLICDIMSPYEPKNPIEGQLWINNGTLLYFDGISFKPVKATDIDYEWNYDTFKDFILSTPMINKGNQVLVDDAATEDIKDPYVSRIRNKIPLRDINGFIHANRIILNKKGVIQYDKYSSSMDFNLYHGAIEDTTFFPQEAKDVTVSTLPNVGTVPVRTSNGDLHVSKIIIGNRYVIYYSEEEKSIHIDSYPSVPNIPETGMLGGYDIRYEDIEQTVPIRGKSGEIKAKGIVIQGRSILYYDAKNDCLNLIECNVNTIDPSSISISTIKPSDGTIVANGKVIKSQFLVPDALKDKFFLNGFHTADYEEISNVCIQYPAEVAQDTTPSFVHVNPDRLIGIEKRTFYIDKNNPIIDVPEDFTEYYGFVNGVGKLLLKPYSQVYSGNFSDPNILNTNATEYFTYRDKYTNGIILTNPSAEKYDYIVTLTYKFGSVRTKGNLNKITKDTLVEDSIFIGFTTFNPIVFVDGLLLNRRDFTYNRDTGYVTLNLKVQSHVAIMLVADVNYGTITIYDEENDISSIPIPDRLWNKWSNSLYDFMLSINGIDISSSDIELDYTIDVANKFIRVKGAKLGMEYSIIPLQYFDDTLLVKDTVVDESSKIICSLEELPIEIEPILFIDGLYISRDDYKRDYDGSITVYNATPGQSVKILKNINEQIVYDDYSQYTTIPIRRYDDAIVYMYNTLLGSSDFVTMYDFPKGVQNQIVYNTKYSNWFKFDKEKGWQLANLTDDEILNYEDLNNGFIKNDTSVSIIKNTGYTDCVIYSYKFANTVENPLKVYTFKPDEIRDEYRTLIYHSYSVNRNELSIYVDNVRQYDIEETSRQSFKVNTPESINKITYVIEECEGTENISCNREILTYENIYSNNEKMFQTKNSLFVPHINVFIAGLRIPKTEYKVLDSNLILFKQAPLDLLNDVNIDRNNYPHGILIETRDDYLLQETVVTVDPNTSPEGQITFGIDDGLEPAMFETDDTILIYINGMLYTDGYTLDIYNSKLTLNNTEYYKILGENSISKHFKENKEDYEKWKKMNNKKEYLQPINTLIFEWR